MRPKLGTVRLQLVAVLGISIVDVLVHMNFFGEHIPTCLLVSS